jgi:glycosyltransferase involved in cell wall biosynthesis
MGVPVVVTPKAQRALDLRSGEGVLVAPSPAEFARSVVQVLQDASLRSDLSLAAIRVARERLSLEATYRRVTDLLASTGLR